MKKFLTIFCVLLIILPFSSSLAYSNDKYSIDIPSEYSYVSEGVFKNNVGYMIEIDVQEFDDEISGELYTEENLKLIDDMIEEKTNYYKDYTKKTIKEYNENNGNVLTQEEINDYLKSFKMRTVKKEIETFTKNNYKCFHILYKMSFVDTTTYIDQYTLVSGKELYSLSVSSKNMSDFENSGTISNVIDSFTIKNFKPYTYRTDAEILIINFIMTFVLFTIVTFILKKILKLNFSNKKAIIIAIINSVVIQIIILIIQYYAELQYGNNAVVNIAPAFFYGFINYYFLKRDAYKKDKKSKEIKVSNDDKLDFNKIESHKENNIKLKKQEIEESNNEDKKRYCEFCGKKVKEEWDFCNYCGKKLK